MRRTQKKNNNSMIRWRTSSATGHWITEQKPSAGVHVDDLNNHEMTIFGEAIDCATLAARTAYLDGACQNDPDLRRRVEDLLRAHETAGQFLDGRAQSNGTAFSADSPLSEHAGMVIGSYKLLEKIGEGGFGVVFLADQYQPVRRKVALKVLKPG